MKFIELYCESTNKTVIVNLNQVISIDYGMYASKVKDKEPKTVITFECTNGASHTVSFNSKKDLNTRLDVLRKAAGLCEGLTSFRNPMPRSSLV